MTRIWYASALAAAILVAGCATAGGGAPAPAASAPSPGDIEASIRARLDSVPAQTTFYAKDLTTGREVAIRADVPMNTASVIKLPVLVRAFRDVDAGRLALDERHTIAPDELRRGTGLLQTFAPGLQPTLHDLLTQMIVTSDNTATDLMISRVGLSRVNGMLDSLGYRATRLNSTIGQGFRAVWEALDPKYASLTDREVFDRGFPNDSGAAARTVSFVLDSTKWLGTPTAREIGRLLEQMQRGQLASDASTRDMLRILGDQFYQSRLPQRVRFEGAWLAHKTGDWPPLLANDVGIMYTPRGPIVMAVFANGNRGSFFDLEATEGRIAEDVLRAWGTR